MTLLSARLEAIALEVEQTLSLLIPLSDVPERRLIEAMRYAVLGGGKRIRPFLVLSVAELFKVSRDSALRAAAAIEMVHGYSLVHDDLPAMDDDDLRRGRPTCHCEFDEATAILVGDALQSRAFQVLAQPETHSSAEVRCELVETLGSAIGESGMVGGQMLDLLAANLDMDMAAITRLQRMKTGKLIAASCEFGVILGRAPASVRQAFRAYAHDLGLAFQIADDLLDVEGSEADLGKKVGKDQDLGKQTFVSLLGIERAREQAQILAHQAAEHLDLFKEKAEPFRQLAEFVVERRY